MKLLGLSMLMSGFLGIVSSYKHLMNMLIGLEFMGLSLICVLVVLLNKNMGEMYLLLILFTFIACEGALGMSIIVSLIRSHGSDYFLAFNILKC